MRFIAAMLDTARLHLRPHRLADLDAIAAVFGDAGVMRHIGGQPLSREDVWQRLLRYHGHWSLFGFGLWAIEERASGRVIGEAGFADFHRSLGSAFDGVPEAAWILAAEAHGHGYAAEAMTAALAWLDARGEARSVCVIAPANTASLRLAERLGYRVFAEARYRGAPTLLHERFAAGQPANAR